MESTQINHEINAETCFYLLREEILKSQNKLSLDITDLELRVHKSMTQLTLQMIGLICVVHGAALALDKLFI